jgi:hypothetical protein
MGSFCFYEIQGINCISGHISGSLKSVVRVYHADMMRCKEPGLVNPETQSSHVKSKLFTQSIEVSPCRLHVKDGC